jgi:hypothetical protein
VRRKQPQLPVDPIGSQRLGFTVAAVSAVVFFGFWLVLGGVVSQHSEASYSSAEPKGPFPWAMYIVVGVFLGGVFAMGAYAITNLIRSRAPKFADLDDAEQRRRQDAASLLRNMDKPPT